MEVFVFLFIFSDEKTNQKNHETELASFTRDYS